MWIAPGIYLILILAGLVVVLGALFMTHRADEMARTARTIPTMGSHRGHPHSVTTGLVVPNPVDGDLPALHLKAEPSISCSTASGPRCLPA